MESNKSTEQRILKEIFTGACTIILCLKHSFKLKNLVLLKDDHQYREIRSLVQVIDASNGTNGLNQFGKTSEFFFNIYREH